MKLRKVFLENVAVIRWLTRLDIDSYSKFGSRFKSRAIVDVRVLGVRIMDGRKLAVKRMINDVLPWRDVTWNWPYLISPHCWLTNFSHILFSFVLIDSFLSFYILCRSLWVALRINSLKMEVFWARYIVVAYNLEKIYGLIHFSVFVKNIHGSLVSCFLLDMLIIGHSPRDSFYKDIPGLTLMGAIDVGILLKNSC